MGKTACAKNTTPSLATIKSLQQLVHCMNTTQEEVLYQALELLGRVIDAQMIGGQFQIIYPDGSKQVVFIPFDYS